MTTTPATPSSGPAWHPDPTDPGSLRYWDGQSWTSHTSPRPAGWEPGASRARVAWWQTWWAVAVGLLLCLPVGLVGLWRRPGVSPWLRVSVTLAAVAGLVGVLASQDGTTTAQDDSASAATTAPSTSTAAPAPAAASEAAPTVTEPPKSVMPRVAGLSRSQAEEALAAAGLGVREVREIPSAKPRGTVLRQGRKEGASVPPGASVVLVVAVPFPRVPAVVGRLEADAVDRLRDAGFRVTVTTENRTSGKDGVVLRQTPAGKDRIKPGSSVTVVVSSVVRPVAAAPAQNCTAGYRPCLPPASDYDCAGGSGNGPAYADGPVYVTGSDPYDLDADGDGVACES